MTYAHLPTEQRRELYLRFKARYGEERALAIIEGRDPQANADLDLWRQLGHRRAATC